MSAKTTVSSNPGGVMSVTSSGLPPAVSSVGKSGGAAEAPAPVARTQAETESVTLPALEPSVSPTMEVVVDFNTRSPLWAAFAPSKTDARTLHAAIQSEIGHSFSRVLNCMSVLNSNTLPKETAEEVLEEAEKWERIDVRELISAKSIAESAEKLDWRPIFASHSHLLEQFNSFLTAACALCSSKTGAFEVDPSCKLLARIGAALYRNRFCKVVRTARHVRKRRMNIVEVVGGRLESGEAVAGPDLFSDGCTFDHLRPDGRTFSVQSFEFNWSMLYGAHTRLKNEETVFPKMMQLQSNLAHPEVLTTCSEAKIPPSPISMTKIGNIMLRTVMFFHHNLVRPGVFKSTDLLKVGPAMVRRCTAAMGLSYGLHLNQCQRWLQMCQELLLKGSVDVYQKTSLLYSEVLYLYFCWKNAVTGRLNLDYDEIPYYKLGVIMGNLQESIGDSVGRVAYGICSTNIRKTDYTKKSQGYNAADETSWCSKLWKSTLQPIGNALGEAGKTSDAIDKALSEKCQFRSLLRAFYVYVIECSLRSAESFFRAGKLKVTRKGASQLLSEIAYIKQRTTAALMDLAAHAGPLPSYARWHNILQLLAEPVAPSSSKIVAMNPVVEHADRATRDSAAWSDLRRPGGERCDPQVIQANLKKLLLQK